MVIRRCAIFGCFSNSRRNRKLQFFRFPSPDNPMYKFWKQNCYVSFKFILSLKSPLVCSLHFHPSQFGLRLSSGAVPTLRMGSQMLEELESIRKRIYIDGVVFEWLVRTSVDSQLRGLITMGLIKEKANAAASLIGAERFRANNIWLKNYRETRLHDFRQKISNNELKPNGTSFKIADIVKELKHLYPSRTADEDKEGNDDQNVSHQDEQDANSSGTTQNQQQNYPHKQQSNQSANQHQNYASSNMQQNCPSPDQQQSSALSWKPQPAETYLPLQLSQPRALKRKAPSTPMCRSTRLVGPVVTKHTKLDIENEKITVVGKENNTDQLMDLADECEVSVNAKNVRPESTSNRTVPPSLSPSWEPITNSTNIVTDETAKPKTSAIELKNSEEAVEYLRPLENFLLFKENFAAIGIISRLADVLLKH